MDIFYGWMGVFRGGGSIFSVGGSGLTFFMEDWG